MKKKIAAAIFVLACFTGCEVTINSSGQNAHFELSPAREAARNAAFDICNGLSAGFPAKGTETSAGNQKMEK